MINGIVAVDKNQGIGFNNSMPWPFLKHDLSWFKRITSNSIVIMGSNTWKSLPVKPLPNRVNVILSKKIDHPIKGVDHIFSDPDAALLFCQTEYIDKEIFIIGGESVYKAFFDKIITFYVTEIDQEYNCDRFFNLNRVKEKFTKVKEHATFFDPVKYTIKEYNI